MLQNMYKNVGRVGESQEARRQKLLTEQKHKRALLQDENRQDLEEVVTKAAETYQKNTSTSRRRKNFKPPCFRKIYSTDHALQQSEWLRERPEDLTEWLLVPCPKGQRCMVVACNGITDMFNKGGRLQMNFRSMLPGDGNGRNAITMLDCIYVKEIKTFFVLDALAFGTQDLLHCDAQFRFFWIKSKLEELDLSETKAGHDFRFLCLDQYDFEDTARVSVALQRYPLWHDNNPELDGFLFYHKEANYTCGTTPLVGWLFPFMVTEVLGYRVSSEYERPANYIDCQQYMQWFDATISKKRRKRRPQSQVESMDVARAVEEGEDDSLQQVLAAQRELELDMECNEELNY